MMCSLVLMFLFWFSLMEALWTSHLMSCRLWGTVLANVPFLSMYLLMFQSVCLNYTLCQTSFSVGVSKCVSKLCIMSYIFSVVWWNKCYGVCCCEHLPFSINFKLVMIFLYLSFSCDSHILVHRDICW
jgi:hypothetical protein